MTSNLNILQVGLVGCGSVAQRGILPHLMLPDARERVQVAAVADVVEERARSTADRFRIPAYFGSTKAMLAGANIDLVIVASPIPFHYEIAREAIEAGKHVYVQKAMTNSLAEADALLAARDRAGVKLAAAPGYELFVTTPQIRAVATGGELGPIYLAYTYTLGFGHEQEAIRGGQGVLAEIDPRWYYRAGAGPLPDVTVYALQLLTSVLGPVRRVTALASQVQPARTWRGQDFAIEVPDNNLVTLEFASGALGIAAGSDCAGSARLPWGGMGLYGARGALEVTDVHFLSGYPLAFEVQSGTGTQGYRAELTEQPYLRGDHLTIDEPHVYADIMDLVDAILKDRLPRATGEQARHVVDIIEKARQAIRTGQTQELTSTFNPVTIDELRPA